MSLLNNRVALVTGGVRGMGESHVRALLDEGARVIIADTADEEGRTLQKELGPESYFVEMDVRSASSWGNAIEITEQLFGPVDILVNNAGILINDRIVDLKESDLRLTLDVNLIGPILGIKSVAPSMMKRGHGSIINISSNSGLAGYETFGAYGASKWALRGVTKTAALELGPFGVRVNSVHPGIVRTSMMDNVDLDRAAARLPLGFIGEPWHISALVVFLASEASAYTTGSEFVADGGRTAGPYEK